ncbi:MAG: hypothetical protein HQL25_00885, partial [Candidatus Omnitrophica bacterium]|nr:hypothetical protein [Candidatus Omnitrophota bacterium]
MGQLIKKSICMVTLVVFIFTSVTPSYGQILSTMPAPGTMVQLSPAFKPALLTGIKVHPDNPFRFEFILDAGSNNDKNSVGARYIVPDKDAIKTESEKLIKYFLASLTVPEKDLWVNLSPVEKDRIVPEAFGKTEMGRDLLAQDYLLKQLTASLLYPEGEIGRQFWEKVYKKLREIKAKDAIDPLSSLRGEGKGEGSLNKNLETPTDIFNKVWIVPEKAVVYENAEAGTAYVVESKLKVLTEQDYFAGGNPVKSLRDNATSQVLKEIVIPALTREVNTGKNFAQLRQVYNSLILAAWYKKKIKDSILNQVYSDKNKISGVDIADSKAAEKIWAQYVETFKKGAYNYIKEEYDPNTQQIIPRKYFSGGVNVTNLTDAAMTVVTSLPENLQSDGQKKIIVDLTPAKNTTDGISGVELMANEIRLPPDKAMLMDDSFVAEPIDSIPVNSEKVEQDGKVLYKSPQALEKMRELDSFVANSEFEVEAAGIGLTKQFSKDPTNQTSVLVDFILPREGKIFAIKKRSNIKNYDKFGDALAFSKSLKLILKGGKIFLESNETEFSFVFDELWPHLLKYIQLLVDQPLPVDIKEVKKLLKEKGEMIINIDWDMVVTRSSIRTTNYYYERVKQKAQEERALPNFDMHYHPMIRSAKTLLEKEPLYDREEFFESLVQFSPEDARYIEYLGMQWFEIRTLGTSEDINSQSLTTQRIYNMDTINHLRDLLRKPIKDFIALPASEITPEKVYAFTTALVNVMETDDDNIDLKAMVKYSMDEEDFDKLEKRYSRKSIKNLKDFVLYMLFNREDSLEEFSSTTVDFWRDIDSLKPGALLDELDQLFSDSDSVIENSFLYVYGKLVDEYDQAMNTDSPWQAQDSITEEDILRVARENGIDVGTKEIMLHVAGSMKGTQTYKLYNEELLRDEGVNIVMIPYQIREDQFDQLIEVIRRSSRIKGANIGAPFKTMVGKYVEEKDDPMAWIGFDTIIKNEGKFNGFRFNGDAWVTAFKDEGHGTLTDKNFVILGAGATGSAIAVALIAEGVKSITFTEYDAGRRTLISDKFSQVSGKTKIKVLTPDSLELQSVIKSADYVINATGLGK